MNNYYDFVVQVVGPNWIFSFQVQDDIRIIEIKKIQQGQSTV